MLNLFEKALANSSALEDAFKAVLAGMSDDDGNVIRDFANWIEQQALISIGTKLFVVLELLNGRTYQNTYERAEEQARLSGRDAKEILREQLNTYYERRIAFDSKFEDGKKFRYAALNAGGLGPSVFSPYCIVLKGSFQSSLDHIACLPGDSLVVTFSDDGSFDEPLFESQIAPHSRRHLLAAKERATEIPTVAREEWPSLILSGSRYFEVIFMGEVTLDSMQCVRVPEPEYTAKWDLTFQNLIANPNDAERALAHDFLQLRREQLAGRVIVEVI